MGRMAQTLSFKDMPSTQDIGVRWVNCTGLIAPPFLLIFVAIFVWIPAAADDVLNLGPTYKSFQQGQYFLQLGKNPFVRATTTQKALKSATNNTDSITESLHSDIDSDQYSSMCLNNRSRALGSIVKCCVGQ